MQTKKLSAVGLWETLFAFIYIFSFPFVILNFLSNDIEKVFGILLALVLLHVAYLVFERETKTVVKNNLKEIGEIKKSNKSKKHVRKQRRKTTVKKRPKRNIRRRRRR